MTRYPYDIGEAAIEEYFPEESKNGGIIEIIDCGELHALLAKFFQLLQDKDQNDV